MLRVVLLFFFFFTIPLTRSTIIKFGVIVIYGTYLKKTWSTKHFVTNDINRQYKTVKT